MIQCILVLSVPPSYNIYLLHKGNLSRTGFCEDDNDDDDDEFHKEYDSEVDKLVLCICLQFLTHK